jgi:hypothetical protein
MKLYFATASDDEGENLDLFVVADSSIEAGQMLIDHWAQDQVEVDQCAGVIVYDAPGQLLPDAVKGVVDWSLLQRGVPQLTYPDTSGWWGDDED